MWNLGRLFFMSHTGHTEQCISWTRFSNPEIVPHFVHLSHANLAGVLEGSGVGVAVCWLVGNVTVGVEVQGGLKWVAGFVIWLVGPRTWLVGFDTWPVGFNTWLARADAWFVEFMIPWPSPQEEFPRPEPEAVACANVFSTSLS